MQRLQKPPPKIFLHEIPSRPARSIFLSRNTHINSLGDITGDILNPSVEQILVADPFLYKAEEKAAWREWLICFKIGCLGNVQGSDALLKVTAITTVKWEDNWRKKGPLSQEIKGSLIGIFDKVFPPAHFPKVSCVPIVIHNSSGPYFHDRSVSVLYKTVDGKREMHQMRMGRGINLLFKNHCDCSQERFGHDDYCPSVTHSFTTKSTEITSVEWEDDAVKLKTLFDNFKDYLQSGNFT